jgi:hypothetical protein
VTSFGVRVNSVAGILTQDCKNLVGIQLVAEDVEDVSKTLLFDAERNSTLNALRDNISFGLCNDHCSSRLSIQSNSICVIWQAVFAKKFNSLKIKDLHGAAGRGAASS